MHKYVVGVSDEAREKVKRLATDGLSEREVIEAAIEDAFGSMPRLCATANLREAQDLCQQMSAGIDALLRDLDGAK